MLSKSVLLKHYKRPDIQHAIIEHAKDKEIGTQYGLGNFGKRPDILSYPQDILELAKQNMTSLHSSEERWADPLHLHSNITKKELNELRIGWDLVLDIDCKIFEYSRICADLVVKFLKYCGVKDISCKFSGNKGFHIGVPFEAFPKKVRDQETRLLFPDAARKIATYITENIKEELGKRILSSENGNITKIKELVDLPQEDIVFSKKDSDGNEKSFLRVDKFLEIDTILIASRHLYRMPYSLHEKSGLVSLPIDPEKVMEFEKQMAQPDAILTPMFTFLGRNITQESARNLLIQALDFEVKEEREYDLKEAKQYEEISIQSPITEDLFPPCVKKLLLGVEDGKKRGIFVLTNFLGKIGWGKQDIEKLLKEWNTKNPEPLREVYLRGQLNHFKPGEKLPPNCSNEGYYTGLGICHPDGLCKRIKNPANYTIVKWKSYLREQENQPKRKGKDSAPVSPSTTNDNSNASNSPAESLGTAESGDGPNLS